MPLETTDTSPTKFPTPEYLTLSNFKRGVITLIDKSRLPQNALAEATNLFLVEDGQPSMRPGTDWFGTSPLETATTVATPPTAAAGTNWTNPTNVTASDNSRAAYATTTQDNLKITGFNFAIPTSATILGFTVAVEGEGGDATAANRSVEVGMTKDGSTLTGTRDTAQNLNQTTDTTLTFGGASNLFGTTWTAAQINATTFGVLLRAANTNAGSRNIDYVTVTVTYTYNFPIDGFDYFDFNGVIHLVAVAGGYVMRSTNNGTTWTQCSGATLTAGQTVYLNQYNAFLYITNGVDQITRYDGTTTLQVYTSLNAPAAPTSSPTGLAGSTYTYYYKTSAVSQIGFSVASAKVTQAVGQPRENWDGTSNYLTLTVDTPQSTQTRMDIYISTDDLNYYYLDSIISSAATPNVTYKDDGSAVIVPSTTAPTDNTTLGPTVAELVNVGSRMYGVRDPNHKYRIWFTSGTAPYGAFSTGYDGGYLDWQVGGKYMPVKVADYRDGKGTPLATVWCKSADGQGCILQMSLDTLTVGNISVTVPSAYKLPGSRGTPAPNSVVNVLNDYMFYNSQAFYNLGSRPQLLQILSTDEVSANIRPTVKTISHSAEANIASAYFDAKVYMSVPYNSDNNNSTAVFDTERKAWLPQAFDIGFSRFLRYTDTSLGQHLLALKPGDNRLSEISTSFQGDYGVAFATSLYTGLYSPTKDRFGFQFVEEMEWEFSNPQGTIYLELLGIARVGDYKSIKIVPFSTNTIVTNAGWDTDAWDVTVWDDTSVVPITVSSSSVKKYTTVQNELNAAQWHVYTNTLDARYVMRTLQTWGTATEGGKPTGWRV